MTEEEWWRQEAARKDALGEGAKRDGVLFRVLPDEELPQPQHRFDMAANAERCPRCGSADIEDDGDERECRDCGHRWEEGTENAQVRDAHGRFAAADDLDAAINGDTRVDVKVFHDPAVAHRFVTDHPGAQKLLEKDELSSSNEEEIGNALTIGDTKKSIVTRGDKLLAASAWRHEDDYIYIDHLGSVAKGGGTRILAGPVIDALRSGKPLKFTGTEEAEGFYDNLGFKREFGATFHTEPKDLVKVARGLASRIRGERA